MSQPDPSLLNHYMWSMAKAVKAFEDTEAVYKVREKTIIARYGATVEADYKLADDSAAREAVANGAWQRDRAKTFALSAIAVMLHEQREAKP